MDVEFHARKHTEIFNLGIEIINNQDKGNEETKIKQTRFENYLLNRKWRKF